MVPFSFCLNHDSRNDLLPIKKRTSLAIPPGDLPTRNRTTLSKIIARCTVGWAPLLSMQPLLITQLKVNINTHWLTTCVIFLPFPFLLRIVSIKKRHLLLNEEKVSEAWYNSIATRETRASLDLFFFFLPPSYLHIRADTRLSVRIRNRGEHKAN